jgi:Raf kinase inhibitor-like YbhB/YbcL family protein
MTSRRFDHAFALALLTSLSAVVGCSSEEPAASGNGGNGGSGGSGATSGSSGTTSGTAGAPGGSGGTAGTTSGGTGGSGVSGSAGSSPGGTGTGGVSGAAGSAAGGAAGAGGASGGGMSGANGGGAGGAGGRGGANGGGAFSITTPAFTNMAGCAANMAAMCATFPRDNTSYGTNVSPAMTWTGAPAGAQSFAVVLHDLTMNFTHWVIWNIPASVTTLAADIPKMAMPSMPAGAQQASFGAMEGYAGPGACGNVYEFTVYALSVPTFSPTQATNQSMVRTQLLALGAQILGTASMRARSFMPNCP